MIEVYTANTPNGVKLPSRLKTTKHTCLAARAYRLRHTLASHGCCSRGRPGGR
jgi:hypothetical protein